MMFNGEGGLCVGQTRVSCGCDVLQMRILVIDGKQGLRMGQRTIRRGWRGLELSLFLVLESKQGLSLSQGGVNRRSLGMFQLVIFLMINCKKGLCVRQRHIPVRFSVLQVGILKVVHSIDGLRMGQAQVL